MNEELNVDFTRYETTIPKKFQNRKKYVPRNPKILQSIIPGSILAVSVKAGDLVAPGDTLMVLEAMKMKNEIKSSIQGRVKKVYVQVGQQLAKGELLIEFETE